jgi:preprotein translocase subunit SecY
MSWKDTAEPVLTRMPAVRRPDGHVPFKRKLGWTAGILVLYFFLTNVVLFGLQGQGQEVFGRFRSILAGSQGSLLQVGIGPIVTASIVLQLLGGADLLGLDPSVATNLGISVGLLEWIIFLQVFVGGILILFMDEVVSKWGVGSGIGLFIIAGVSQRMIGGLLSTPTLGGEWGIIPMWGRMLLGQAETASILTPQGIVDLLINEGQLLAIFTTVAIFVIVVYAESVRVEIPLSNTRVKGARGRFPVKLIYASVLPMILVRALQMNIQFLGRILASQWSLPTWLGVYVDGQPQSGLFYYLNPIQSPNDWMWFVGAGGGNSPLEIMTRVTVDLTIMILGGAIFAIFWVKTTNMGPEATAQQIHGSGMQIPGFRQNVRSIERVLDQYIPQVTVIGGALVGLLAVGANMLGTIGGVSGTGLLLTVSITYKLYEEIAEEQLMEMHPMMRQMFG